MALAGDRTLTIGLVFDDSLDRPDGVQQQVRLLGEWLSSLGHDVHYLVGETSVFSPPNGTLHSLSRNLRVAANQNQLSLPLPAKHRRLVRLFDQVDFDLLHVMLPFSPFLGRQVVQLALQRQIPLVGTFHTYPSSNWQDKGSVIYGWWLKRRLKKFSILTSVSSATAEYARRTFGVESTVVPNFIDVERFRRAKPIEQLRSGSKLLIVFIGRLVERKGAKYLIQAAAKLDPGLRQKIKIYIGGKGPQRPELEQLIAANDLEPIVHLAGFVDKDDKPKILAAADMAIYPATGGEAFGIVLLEAMAAGAVTLGGDNPGYRSVLAPIGGTLFQPINSSQLADMITALAQDPARRQEIRRQQQAYAQQFSVERVGQQILDLYQAAVAER